MSSKRAAAKAARLAEEVREAREFTLRFWDEKRLDRRVLSRLTPADLRRLMLAASSATADDCDYDATHAAENALWLFRDLADADLLESAAKSALVDVLMEIVRRPGYRCLHTSNDGYALRSDAADTLGYMAPEAKRALPLLIEYMKLPEADRGVTPAYYDRAVHAIARIISEDEEVHAAIAAVAEKEEARCRRKGKRRAGGKT